MPAPDLEKEKPHHEPCRPPNQCQAWLSLCTRAGIITLYNSNEWLESLIFGVKTKKNRKNTCLIKMY